MERQHSSRFTSPPAPPNVVGPRSGEPAILRDRRGLAHYPLARSSYSCGRTRTLV